MFSIFKKKKKDDYSAEKTFFRWKFKRYTVEYGPIWKLLARSIDKNEVLHLGSYNPNTREFERVKDFYLLPWDVQRAANKLFDWAINGNSRKREY